MPPIHLEKHVLDIICSVFDAHSAVLFLPLEESDRYYLAAFSSLGNNIREKAVIESGEGLVGWIIHNSRYMVISPFDQNEEALGYYLPNTVEGIKAFMGFPLPTGGAICVDSKRQYSFSEKELKILQLFAEQISIQQTLAVRDYSGDIPRYFADLGLIQDLRFRYRRWPVFLQNFLNIMVTSTKFDYCAFASLAPDGEAFLVEGESTRLLLEDGTPLRMPIESGIAGWVLSNGRPVFTDGQTARSAAIFGNLEQFPDFHSAICMPVKINKSVCGVLALASSQLIDIDESMRGFVRQAIDHLGLFLENLYLKNHLRKLLPQTKAKMGNARPNNPNAVRPDREQRDE